MQAACSIVQVGSMRHDLHIIAINIFNLCAANNIKLEIQWIPRNELEKADFFSRIIDIDDWQISHGLFRFLDNSWGLHTVDCFPNRPCHGFRRHLERNYSV